MPSGNISRKHGCMKIKVRLQKKISPHCAVVRTHVGIINGDSRLMNVSHNFSFLVLHLKVFKKMTRLTDLKGNKNSKKTTGKRIYCSFCRDCTIQVKRLKVKRGHKSLPKKRLKSLTLVYIYGQKSARRCHHHHPLQTIYQ